MNELLGFVIFCAFTLGIASLVLVVIISLCRSINNRGFPAVDEEKKPDLTPLPGLVDVITSSLFPDMITLDNSTFAKRALMMCGHVISPESMEDYAWDVISKGGIEIVCPHPGCDAKWPYGIVKHVACLSIRRMKEFDQRISENYLENNSEFRKCPNCSSWISRYNPNSNRADCSVCTKTRWGGFSFCWVCLRKWKSPDRGNDCGNPDSNDMPKKIKILAECPEIKICYRMCPSVRGCPNCGTLIEFIERCNHMQCVGCKHYFCFICVSRSSPTLNGTICEAYSTTCLVAKRQTSLP